MDSHSQLTHYAVLSNGHVIDNPHFLRRPERRLRKAQQTLSRKAKGSANRAKARIKVARAHAKVADARKDWCHQTASRLIRDNQAVYLQDPAVSGPARTRLAKSVPEPKDQRANRRRRGGTGGRPAGFDRERYRRRNEVERTINRLKNSRAVATRYDKRAYVSHGTVTAAAIRLWLRPRSAGQCLRHVVIVEEGEHPGQNMQARVHVGAGEVAGHLPQGRVFAGVYRGDGHRAFGGEPDQ